MTAKEYLEQIKKADERIQNKSVELYQLKCLATSVTVATDKEPVATSGVSDKVGNTVIKIVELSDEINAEIDAFIELRAKCIAVIEKLENSLEYAVIHQHYVQYKTLAQIAIDKCYTHQYIIEVHKKALKNIQNILTTYKNI